MFLAKISFLFVLMNSSHTAFAFIDDTHQTLSTGVTKLSDSIDTFVSNDTSTKLTNNSKIQISIDISSLEGKGPIITPEINYRLILPKTQKKMQFIINTNEEKTENKETQNALDTLNSENQSESATAALRFYLRDQNIESYIDSGLIVNLPLEVFLRHTLRKVHTLGRWRFTAQNKIRWRSLRGVDNTIDMDFKRQLSDQYTLEFANQTSWDDRDYTIRFQNGPTLHQRLSKDSGLTYNLHAITFNKPDMAVNHYILLLKYRRNLYKNWIFLGVSPFLNFSREDNFHRRPGLILTLQTIYGYIK